MIETTQQYKAPCWGNRKISSLLLLGIFFWTLISFLGKGWMLATWADTISPSSSPSSPEEPDVEKVSYPPGVETLTSNTVKSWFSQIGSVSLQSYAGSTINISDQDPKLLQAGLPRPVYNFKKEWFDGESNSPLSSTLSWAAPVLLKGSPVGVLIAAFDKNKDDFSVKSVLSDRWIAKLLVVTPPSGTFIEYKTGWYLLDGQKVLGVDKQAKEWVAGRVILEDFRLAHSSNNEVEKNLTTFNTLNTTDIPNNLALWVGLVLGTGLLLVLLISWWRSHHLWKEVEEEAEPPFENN